jgi:hypothetical protein
MEYITKSEVLILTATVQTILFTYLFAIENELYLNFRPFEISVIKAEHALKYCLLNFHLSRAILGICILIQLKLSSCEI